MTLYKKLFSYGECKAEEVRLSKGTYLLEVWGASGGTYRTDTPGGAGGYARGVLTLKKATKAFVHLGKEGSQSGKVAVCNGGGGGLKGGGGGGTDIRLESDSLYSRVIVAGGGGGSGDDVGDYGGFGGGETGKSKFFQSFFP